MTDGPEAVVKWIIGVANHAGRLHCVRSMPWAAMWATELRSLLRVVGIYQKKPSNLGVYVSKKNIYSKNIYSKCTATFESAYAVDPHMMYTFNGHSKITDRRHVSKVTTNDRQNFTLEILLKSFLDQAALFYQKSMQLIRVGPIRFRNIFFLKVSSKRQQKF
jgi:hypothetical protein